MSKSIKRNKSHYCAVLDFIFATHSIKRIIYLALLVGINFAIYHNPNDLSRYWAVWAAIFLSFIIWEENLVLRVKLILQTGLAFIIAAGVFGWLATFPLILPLSLCCFIMCVVIFSQTRVQYFLSALVVSLFAMISGLLTPTMLENERRMMMLGIGVLILLTCQLIFYFRPIKDQLRISTYTSFANLRGLNKAIFASLIDPLYKDNIYLFERRIHLNKNKCIQSMIAFQKILGGRNSNVLDKLNLLYDSLQNSSMLRFRIKDHDVLKVCESELIGLFQAIDQVLMSFMKVFSRFWLKPKVNTKQHIEQVLKWIDQLEENYQHFLQAVAHDPLSFFLFIASLKSLALEMESFKCHAQDDKW